MSLSSDSDHKDLTEENFSREESKNKEHKVEAKEEEKKNDSSSSS